MRKFVLSIFAVLLLCLQGAMAQNMRVSGTVTSNDGTPIIGASVIVKGTQNGASTGVDGRYSLSNVPTGAILQFSSLGMFSKEENVSGRTVINVNLEEDVASIDDVVVIGYGSAKKLGTVAGSVATINASKIASRPSANFADALQGQVSGLQVFTSSGEPSSMATMRLRGVNSMNASNTPLFILDGSPVGQQIFNALNPNDIENITVLKDASAAAIYGSRAANGVIVITTKRAKLGEKARVQVRAQYGVSMRTNNKLDMMNAEELLRFEEMVDPSKLTNAAFQAKKAFVQGNGINYDWNDYYFKSAAPVSSYDISIQGANEMTNYYTSMSYYSQEGTALNSYQDRMSFRSNVDTKINRWIRFGANVGLSYSKYETSTVGWYTHASALESIVALPYEVPFEIVQNEDGTISYGDELDVFPWNGAVASKYYYDKSPSPKTKVQLSGNTFLQLNPIEGLIIRAAQGIDAFDYSSRSTRLPSYIPNLGNGSVSESFQRYYQLTATNTAEYKWNLNKEHNFTALIGQEAIVTKDRMFSASSTGQSDDRLMLISAGTTPGNPSASEEDIVFNSYFASVNYNYANKYFFDGSVRMDGSSKFGRNKRNAIFYSGGVMWDLKKENFLATNSLIDDLRLKFSYGTTGNSGITNYLAYGLIGSGPKYNGEAGWGIKNPSNDDLSWEVVRALNVGISGRLANFFSFELDFYDKVTKDMLMEIPFSATTGFTGGWGNIGSMGNRGIDVDLSFDIINTRDFSWNVRTNFNYNDNKFIKLYGDVTEFIDAGTGYKYQEGKPFGEFFDVKFAGVDPRDGAALWYDLNGNKTKQYSEANAQFWGGNSFAKWSGGLSTNFAWKGLTLGADFAWVGQRYMWLNEKFYTANTANAGNTNFERRMLNMWMKPGQITDIPRAGTPFVFDTSLYENAAFLRLKNLSIGYTIPEKLIKKSGFIEGARVYAIGRNLLTVTEFRGYDPEVDSNGTKGTYPNSRQYTFGVELTF